MTRRGLINAINVRLAFGSLAGTAPGTARRKEAVSWRIEMAARARAGETAPPMDIATLEAFERKALWLSSHIIHNANHLRPSADGIKVGGHQASSASLATVMTALYLRVLRPEDRVAVKPHASPVFHALQYLLGNQTLDNLKAFRGLGGAQSYPSRTKDADDVDFSTGSVGLGVAVRRSSPRWCRIMSAPRAWGLSLARGAHGRADGRRRTRRGQHLRMPARGLEARTQATSGG
jgi:hypothetical protein